MSGYEFGRGYAALAAAAVLAAAPALAAAPLADAQAEVSVTMFNAAATLAAFERQADARLRAQREQIAALAAQVRAGDQRHRAELTRQQNRFVAQLAAKDRAYAQAIALFRSDVADIAATAEGAAALARFNAGDELGALAVLDRINQANDRMRAKRDALASAAEQRRIAALALEARSKGKLGTGAVIARYESVVALDPDGHWDWVMLARLYRDAGRLADARRAAQQAIQTARDDRDRSAGLNEFGDVLVRAGDLAGAAKAYDEGLAIARKLAAGDAEKQRDVTVSLDRIGNLAMLRGDLAGAAREFGEFLAITRKLAVADPGNAGRQRDVAVSLDRIGKAAMEQDDLALATEAFGQQLVIARKLAAGDPGNFAAQRDVRVTLGRIADMAMRRGDVAEAARTSGEELDLARKLVANDPVNAEARRDVALSLDRNGDVARRQGDLAGAARIYGEALDIRRKLAAADPGDALAQLDLAISLEKQADLPGATIHWRDVAAHYEQMAAKGMLAPVDQKWLIEAREKARAEAAK